IGKRGRMVFLVVNFLLLPMANTACGVVISTLLFSTPASVIPTWDAIAVAVLIGQAIYGFRGKLPLVSSVGVVSLYSLMILGDQYPISLPDTVLGIPANGIWIIILFIYAFFASLLPVWVLLQPRDYINGLQLFIGLGILYASFLFTRPDIVAPALRDDVPAGTPGMFPLLFVTIACGAISGFHGMVASGTSSKQLDKETDSRFVGYFGAVGEGLLALGTIIATTAGYRTYQEWETIYSEFNAGGVEAFVDGGGNLLNEGLAISTSLSATIFATRAVLFTATTMVSGVRLHRIVVQELCDTACVKINTFVATSIAVLVAFGLTFSQGTDGSGGMTIWPLFGTTNQLMAGLSLSILLLILMHLRRPTWPIIIPLVFLTVMSLWAAFIQLGTFFQEGNWLPCGTDVIIVLAAIWIIVEVILAIGRMKETKPLVWTDEDQGAPPLEKVDSEV